MTLYDGVVGIDEPALNQFVQSVYQTLHDVALKGTVTLPKPQLGVSAVSYDVASVPLISLSPSALVQQHYRAMLAAMNVPAGSLDSAAAAQSQASFGLTIETLNVAVNYANGSAPTQFQASVQAGLEVTVETAAWVMTPSVTTLQINVPADPILSDLINKALIPELISMINAFLKPVQVPPLGLGAIQLSPPAVVTGDGRLLATTALAPAVPGAAPLQGSWPQQVVFAAVDTALVNELLDTATAGKPIEGNWQETFHLGPIEWTIHADYAAAVSQFAVTFVPGQNGQLQGTAQLHGTAVLKSKLGQVSATLSATPTVQATASISGNELVVKLDALDNITVALDDHNFFGILDDLISDIVNVFSVQISAALTPVVAALPPQPITKIPSIPVTVKSQTVVITLQNPGVTTIETPDGKTLLAMTGGANVVVKPPMPQHTANIEQPQLATAGT
jgi:hypothetical protein